MALTTIAYAFLLFAVALELGTSSLQKRGRAMKMRSPMKDQSWSRVHSARPKLRHGILPISQQLSAGQTMKGHTVMKKSPLRAKDKIRLHNLLSDLDEQDRKLVLAVVKDQKAFSDLNAKERELFLGFIRHWGNHISNWWNGVTKSIVDGFNWLKDAIKDVLDQLSPDVAKFLGQHFEGMTDEFEEIVSECAVEVGIKGIHQFHKIQDFLECLAEGFHNTCFAERIDEALEDDGRIDFTEAYEIAEQFLDNCDGPPNASKDKVDNSDTSENDEDWSVDENGGVHSDTSENDEDWSVDEDGGVLEESRQFFGTYLS